VEPGGKVPAWMVNIFATEGPLAIFKQMKIQIEKPAYKNVVLPFVAGKQYAASTF
jgi:hypothetical protein